MRGKLVLYMDQYNRHIVARSVKELRQSAGGGRVSRMYTDSLNGKTYHTGYVVGPYWFTAFVPLRTEAR
jgi:hypothetical protein